MSCDDGIREALLRAFKSAVVNAARERGLVCADFGEAALALPDDVFAAMRANYAEQVQALDMEQR